MTTNQKLPFEVFVSLRRLLCQLPVLLFLVQVAPAHAAATVTFANGSTWTVNQNGLSTANISGNVFYGTDGNGSEAVTAWYNNLVEINGFVATFTYRDVGGSPGNNADGLTFDLQESGPAFIGGGGGSLAISGLVPSANWELNLYSPNGIGIIYNTNGTVSGYLPTGPVNVSSGDPINFTIAYAPGGAVQESLTDVVSGSTFTTNYNVGDLTALLGSSYAYIGFSSADGGVSSVQTVSNFTFQVQSNFAPAVVTNLSAADIHPTTATVNGQVLSTGGIVPTITLYFGPTDGRTNAANWANSSVLGFETGTFSQAVSGLSPSTTYYYTFSATNPAGITWASPSRSFSTIAAAPPQVTNAPATAVGATLATLNGTVLKTGGLPTTVILYYGLTDQGANAGAWSHSVSLGVQGGSYAQTISTLSANTTYYFTAEATNLLGAAWATPSQAFTTISSNPASPPATVVLTQHNDNNRSGDNLNETLLNITNVNTNEFGLLYTRPVDDQIYAQPLVMTNVSILGRGTHNIVVLATVNDTVYAYDADDPSAVAPYWERSFTNLPNVVPPRNTDESAVGACGGSYIDYSGSFGIVGTPVIDPVSKSMFLVVRTKENGSSFVQRLHALDLTTGLDRSGSPVVITATYPGTGDGSSGGVVSFDGLRENQRPGLALADGMVFVTWSSHCDNGPYHGWVIGYNETNLQQQIVWNDTPNGSDGGIWMSGQAPAADTNGNIYLTTGNGTVDTTDYGNAFLKLIPTNGTMNVASYFIPYNWLDLNNGDLDLGTAGLLLIPGTSLAISGGKAGVIYLVNRDPMGGVSSGSADTNILQSWSLNSREIHGAPVWWKGPNGSFVYVWADSSDQLRQYQLTNDLFNTNAYALGPSIGGNGSPGGILSISANNTNAASGILWATVNTTDDANQAVVTGTLHAFSAHNVSDELWNSDMVPRDSLGNLAKFVPPTVANGRVYVATFSNRLNVYGLLPPPLDANLKGRNVVLSWPTNNYPDYILESCPDIISGNWTSVTNTMTMTNGLFQITVPASQGISFFRLKL